MKFGVLEQVLHSRLGPMAMAETSYRTAGIGGADSSWLPDHLNSLLPQAVMNAKYSGAARLAPEIDAFLEPWTALGHLAGRHRFNRARLGTCVTDTGRRNPAVTAQAAATLHLMTRGARFSESEPANAKATSRTGWTGLSRWLGSKKPWQPYGRYGTRTASW